MPDESRVNKEVICILRPATRNNDYKLFIVFSNLAFLYYTLQDRTLIRTK